MSGGEEAPARGAGGRWGARLAVALGLVVLAMVLPDRHGITTIAEANTAVRMYAVQSWVHYDRWSLEEVLCRLHPTYSPIDLSVRDGLPELQKAPGLSWLAVPLYGAAVATRGGERLPTHWSQTFLALLCVLLPLVLALWALARRMTPKLGGDLALLAVVTALAASPLFIYGSLFMDYGLASACLLGGLLALRSRRAAAWVLGGVLLGYAGCTNYLSWPLGALVGAIELIRRFRHREHWRPFMLWTLAGTALPLGALLAYNQTLWGSPFLTGYDFMDHELHRARSIIDTPAAMLGKALITDPKHGIFRFAPWTVFGLLGLVVGVRRGPLRYWSITGLALTTACLLFTTFWQAEFKDDAAFARHMVPAFPWLALGLALFVRQVRDAVPHEPALRGLVFGLVAATLAYAAALQFVTGWTFPYHPLKLESPVWQLNVPLFVNGIHIPLTDWDPWRVPGREQLGGHWGWVAVTALGLVVAFAIPWLGARGGARRSLTQQVVGVVAGVVFVGALGWGGLASNPVGPDQILAAQRIHALGFVDQEPTPEQAALLETVRTDRSWYRKVSEEIVGSYFTGDDVGWNERGYRSRNPWCRVASGGDD